VLTYGDWRRTRFFPGLEGVRGIAALLVVFHHARSHHLWGWLQGWNGVTLFFVLSGFLITTLALREEEERGSLRVGAFAVRRVFRILPVYLVSLALYAAAMVTLGLGAEHRDVFAHAVPWYLSPFPEVPFFTRVHIVFSLAWSLGIEEKFYLLWPLVGFVLLRNRARGRLGVALVLALVCQLPIVFTTAGRAVAPYTAILVGCVVAFLLHDRRAFAAVSKLGTNAGFAVSLALLGTVHAATNLWQPTAEGFRVASPYYYLPYSVAAALVVASIALRPRRVLVSRPLRFAGRISYPLYLTHPLALGVAGGALAPGGTTSELAYFAVGATLAFALAYGVHRVVELPLIALGRRVARRPVPVAPRPLPAAA
jgi:peptidoglycan/LPS O-acetylase OafA/YrhL